MSRIGKKPITIPNNVKIAVTQERILEVEGGKGKLHFKLPLDISTEAKNNSIYIKRSGDTKLLKSLHGLNRSVVYNMIKGVTEGYSKELEIVGIGFKAQMQGSNLVLNMSFSHPVNFPVPEGIKIETSKPTQIVVRGMDKAKVGDTAAKIREIFPPEPYKGKGIRYAGEYVRKKIRKAATK